MTKDEFGKLELLGDSLLSSVIIELLYESFTTLPKGEIVKLKSYLVSNSTLRIVSRKNDIKDLIPITGKKPIADNVEANIGLYYRTHGYVLTKNYIEQLYKDIPFANYCNYKSDLQERLQAIKKPCVYHTVQQVQKEHEKILRFVSTINGYRGHGTSKKKAEQNAAKAYLNSNDWR